MIRKALPDLPFQLWFCPVHEDCDSRPVEWIDDVAYCLFPGCGRTSADPVPRGECMCDEYDCVGQCCGTGQCTCTPELGGEI